MPRRGKHTRTRSDKHRSPGRSLHRHARNWWRTDTPCSHSWSHTHTTEARWKRRSHYRQDTAHRGTGARGQWDKWSQAWRWRERQKERHKHGADGKRRERRRIKVGMLHACCMQVQTHVNNQIISASLKILHQRTLQYLFKCIFFLCFTMFFFLLLAIVY